MIKTTIGFALLATTFLSSAASAFDITTDDLLEKLSNSPNVSWEEVGEDKKDETDVIAVNLPNDQTKYFRYTYSKPDGYEVITKPELMLPTITDPSEQNTYQTGGVAVNNPAGNKYGDITGKVFANNKVSGKLTGTSSYNNLYILGGAVYNAGEIGDITADFINNSLTGTEEGSNSLYLRGGAIYNSDTGTIGNITGNFIGNYASKGAVYSVRDAVYGGAIYNDGTIGNITGNFIGNYTSSTTKTAYTGAISNSGTIGDITGNFIANHTLVNAGAILNGGTINSITGDFIGNYTKHSNGVGSWGGTIYNSGTIDSIIGDFIGNHIDSYGMGNSAEGGAIYNSGTINSIIGDFIGNYIQNDDSSSNFMLGGAIRAEGGSMTISGNFLYNYAVKNDTQSIQRHALGGAVYIGEGDNHLIFKSRDQTLFFSGNYTKDINRGKNYNAIFINTYSGGDSNHIINFDTTGGGAWIINDNIDGADTIMWDMEGKIDYSSHYTLTFKGDGALNEDGLTNQYISINNDIINAGVVIVDATTLRFGAYQHEDQTANNWDGHGRFIAALNADGTADLDAAAVTSLSLNNAAFDLYNQYQDTVELAGYKANNSFLHLDVDVENLTADVLKVNGNVEGTTKLVLYPTSGKDIRGESILFAQSENDTTGNADSFAVWRVYRSPYMFDVKYTQTAENANKWELTMGDEANEYAGVEPGERPNPDVPDPEIPDVPTPEIPTVNNRKVAPEVIAYGALPMAAIEQTRSMVDNVANQITNNRVYTRSCSFVDAYWNGEPHQQLWVNPTYYTSNYDAPFDIDADIWGIEAGGDLQHDLNNKIGVFVSYRKGNYDMNGNGKHYYATIGSEVDIDSYLAGLYYRYDKNNWYGFATLYGGIQQADIKTDDGIKSDTDGVEFGGSVEAGYDYALTDTVYLTPSLGAFYTQVNYDDATDSAGKRAKYSDLRQIELEAGVKLTKVLKTDDGLANVYLKPSIVQTFVDGDEVNINGLGKVNTLDDDTLGRVELGGRWGFTDQLSAYGWANYTFGSDYDAATFGLGLNYAW